MKPMTYQSETGLIENPEQPDNNSFPVNSATFNRSNDQNSHEVQDMVTYTGLTRNDHQRFWRRNPISNQLQSIFDGDFYERLLKLASTIVWYFLTQNKIFVSLWHVWH